MLPETSEAVPAINERFNMTSLTCILANRTHIKVMGKIFLLFLLTPIIEMWLLIEVGARIGALPTIGLVFLTAAIGLALLRQQGFDTLLRLQQRLERGEMPAGEIFEGFALAVGGALLLTPGFVTDAVGFLLLIPQPRRGLVRYLLRDGSRIVMTQTSFHSGPQHRNPAGNDAIEGEFQRKD